MPAWRQQARKAWSSRSPYVDRTTPTTYILAGASPTDGRRHRNSPTGARHLCAGMADHDPRTGIFHGRAMTGMQEQWQKISENLRGVLNPGIFKVWIHPLDAHIEGNSLCLAAPSEYVARWLRDALLEHMLATGTPF